MGAIRTRLEALESAVRPAAAVILDPAMLSDDDRQFIDEVSAKYELDDDRPDYSRLSVPELRRLADIAETYTRAEHESA